MQSEQKSNDSEQDTWFTSQEYHNALVRLGNAITPTHRRMLTAHAKAPDSILSVRQLAAAGGSQATNFVYSTYGKLGRLIAGALGINEEWKVWTRFIGQDFRTETKELMWEMHPELVEALQILNWANPFATAYLSTDLDSSFNETETIASETEREALSLARLGQGSFRVALVKYWGSCAVTGVSEPTVLRASHIKPWRSCTNIERLYTFNGLLLAAHIDALFDKGLITFELSGLIRLSSLLAKEDCRLLGISPNMRLRLVDDAHKEYLQFHHKLFRTA